MSTGIFSTVSRHWATCKRFTGPQDWIFYAYGRILRRISWHLPARNAVVRVRIRGEQSPFHLRLSSTDWLVCEEIFHRKEYGFIKDRVTDARCIVDLGANAGFSVRYWDSLFPRACIIAVEPDAGNCRICRQNISAANLNSRVTLVQAAVGVHSGRGQLVDAGGEWAYRVKSQNIGVAPAVEIRRLDEILAEHAPGRTIDLLKCDIEGGEKELFAEPGEWIQRVQAIVIELHPPYTLSHLKVALSRAHAPFVVAQVSTKQSCPVVFLRRAMEAPCRPAGNTAGSLLLK